MKKFISFVTMLMCIMSFGAILTACGEKPVSIAVKENTLDTELYVGETLNLNNLILLVTYDNEEVKEVAKNNDMEFSNIDTSTEGEKTLTITYLDLTTTVTITVTVGNQNPQDNIVITSFEMPQFVVDYQTSSTEIVDDPSTSTDESRNSFVQTQKIYKVGDDNAFVFKPVISGYIIENDEIGEVGILDWAPSTITIQQKVGDQYSTLQGDALLDVAVIDEQKYSFDFSDDAIGNTYKITISAQTNSGNSEVSIEFEVVDGYNVYTVGQLSVIDNNPATQDDWAELKTQNNVPQDINPSAVVLHGNMVITDADVPANYFYQEDDNDIRDTLLGSLRNKKSIYTHDTPQGETFTLYGNYFSIDASAVSLVNVRALQQIDPGNNLYGDSVLLAFGGNNDEHPETEQGNVVIESLRMDGNGNREENEDLIGGLMGVLNTSNSITMNNTIMSAFVTHFNTRPHNGEGTGNWEITSTISNSKWYDSFSVMIYYCAAKYNYIENSILSGSGGPVIDLVHYEPQNFPDSRYTTVEVIDSTLETSVNGTEAWFVYNNATETAAQLLALDQLLLQSSSWAQADAVIENAKAMAPDGRANILALSAAWNPLGNTSPLLNKLTFKDAEGNVLYDYDMNNQTLKYIASQIDSVMPGASSMLPFFNTGNSFASVTVNESLQPVGIANVVTAPMTPLYTQGTASSLDDTTKAYIQDFYNGDFLGFYLNGVSTLGLVAQFKNV